MAGGVDLLQEAGGEVGAQFGQDGEGVGGEAGVAGGQVDDVHGSTVGAAAGPA
ncbi:hypothetical protein ACW23B_12575 [Streptomyces albidoflavus]